MIDTSKFFPYYSKEDQIELESWLEKGRIQYLFKFMLENIVVDRPNNVYRYLLNKINSWPVLKLSVIAFDKVSYDIPLDTAKFFNIERIDPDRIMAKEIKYNTAFGIRAKASLEQLGYHDEQIVFELVYSRIKYIEKQGKSWLLYNYPKTKNDAINLRLHGIFLDYVICLKKQETYYETIDIFREYYKQEFYQVYIDGLSKGRISNAVRNAVYSAKKATVDTRPPAIWVIGPTLSGKTTIAKKLAEKYDLFYFNLDGMSDKQVVTFVKETLVSREVYVRGYVMDGFPLELKHYKILSNNSIVPSHIINLVIASDADVLDRNNGLYEDLFYPSVRIYFSEERKSLSKERYRHCPKYDEPTLIKRVKDYRESIVEIDTNNYKVIKNFDADEDLNENIQQALLFIETEEHITEIEMIKGKSEVDDAIKLLKLKFRNLGVPMIQVFSKYDDNGGGDLDKDEFTEMIQEVIPEISDDLCHQIFDDFDLDKDGTVDQDEFLRKML